MRNTLAASWLNVGVQLHQLHPWFLLLRCFNTNQVSNSINLLGSRIILISAPLSKCIVECQLPVLLRYLGLLRCNDSAQGKEKEVPTQALYCTHMNDVQNSTLHATPHEQLRCLNTQLLHE